MCTWARWNEPTEHWEQRKDSTGQNGTNLYAQIKHGSIRGIRQEKGSRPSVLYALYLPHSLSLSLPSLPFVAEHKPESGRTDLLTPPFRPSFQCTHPLSCFFFCLDLQDVHSCRINTNIRSKKKELALGSKERTCANRQFGPCDGVTTSVMWQQWHNITISLHTNEIVKREKRLTTYSGNPIFISLTHRHIQWSHKETRTT